MTQQPPKPPKQTRTRARSLAMRTLAIPIEPAQSQTPTMSNRQTGNKHGGYKGIDSTKMQRIKRANDNDNNRLKRRKERQPESKGPGCLGWIQLLVMFIGIAALASGHILIGIPIIVLGLAIGKHQFNQLHK